MTRTCHPLEPLSADEVLEAVALLKAADKITPTTRLVSISLHEPPKKWVQERRLRHELLLRGHALPIRGGVSGFLLKPPGFFDLNPANDVPPSPKKLAAGSCCG
jgi:Cu2+-containing amine oxidase